MFESVSQDKPFACKQCSESFGTSQQLASHVRHKHAKAAAVAAAPEPSPDPQAAAADAPAYVQPFTDAPVKIPNPAVAVPPPPSPVAREETPQYLGRMPMTPPEDRAPVAYEKFANGKGEEAAAAEAAKPDAASDAQAAASDPTQYDLAELASQMTDTYFPKNKLSEREKALVKKHSPKYELTEASSGFVVLSVIFGKRFLEDDVWRGRIWGWCMSVYRWAMGESPKKDETQSAPQTTQREAEPAPQPQRRPASQETIDVRPEPPDPPPAPKPADPAAASVPEEGGRLTDEELAAIAAEEEN